MFIDYLPLCDPAAKANTFELDRSIFLLLVISPLIAQKTESVLYDRGSLYPEYSQHCCFAFALHGTPVVDGTFIRTEM